MNPVFGGGIWNLGGTKMEIGARRRRCSVRSSKRHGKLKLKEVCMDSKAEKSFDYDYDYDYGAVWPSALVKCS